MTIDGAIEQLTRWVQHPPGVVFSNELDAAKLGIEALKYYQKVRKGPYHSRIPLLPGETKDQEKEVTEIEQDDKVTGQHLPPAGGGQGEKGDVLSSD